MVTPETSGSDEAKRPRNLTIAIGVLGLAAGLAAIIALTQPDPPPPADALPTTPSTVPLVEPPSTTTTTAPFRVADVVSGPQIEWVGRDLLPGNYVVDAVEKDGTFYLFVAGVGENEFDLSGLYTWIWDEGWLNVGEITAELENPRVVDASPGFVAYGTDSNHHPMIWTSPDGVDWTQAQLPRPEPDVRTSVRGSGSTDQATIIVAEEWQDSVGELVSRAVSEHYPGLSGYLHESEGRWSVVVVGPLGLPVARLTLDEVGLPADTTGASPTIRRILFIGTRDARSWRRVVLNDDRYAGAGGFIELIPSFNGPDGRLLAHGFRPDVGQWGTYASAEGTTWEPVDLRLPDPMGLVRLGRWGDRYLKMTTSSGVPWLQISNDLQSWERLFEPPRDMWRCCNWSEYFHPDLAAGPAGVATTVLSGEIVPVAPEPPSLTRGEYELIPRTNGLFLFRGETAVIYPSMWEPGRGIMPARLLEDGETVVIVDPRTEEELTTFTIAELANLENRRNSATSTVTATDSQHVLFFSPDGENWTTQDLGDVVSPGAAARIFVGTDSLIVISNTEAGAFVWTGIPPTVSEY